MVLTRVIVRSVVLGNHSLEEYEQMALSSRSRRSDRLASRQPATKWQHNQAPPSAAAGGMQTQHAYAQARTNRLRRMCIQGGMSVCSVFSSIWALKQDDRLFRVFLDALATSEDGQHSQETAIYHGGLAQSRSKSQFPHTCVTKRKTMCNRNPFQNWQRSKKRATARTTIMADRDGNQKFGQKLRVQPCR